MKGSPLLFNTEIQNWTGCFSKAKSSRDAFPDNFVGVNLDVLLLELSKDSPLMVKDGPAIIPSTFAGRRSKDNAIAYSVLAYDFDDWPLGKNFQELPERVKLPCLVHTTYNDNLFSKRKLRAYYICKEIESSDLYESRWSHYAHFLKGLGLDTSTGDRTRLNFTIRKNAELHKFVDQEDPFGITDPSGRGWIPFENIEEELVRNYTTNLNLFNTSKIRALFPSVHTISPPITFKLHFKPPRWCIEALKYSSNLKQNDSVSFDNRRYNSRSELEYLVVSELIACGKSFKEIGDIFTEHMPGSFTKHALVSDKEAERWLLLTYKNALFARIRQKSLQLWNVLNDIPLSKTTSLIKVFKSLLEISFQLNNTIFFRSQRDLMLDSGIASFSTINRTIRKLEELNLISTSKKRSTGQQNIISQNQ